MYETFFEMQNTPFSKAVLSSELYESPAMADALGRLAYTADRQLFAVVTADAGCGKSTLIRRFADSLPREEYLRKSSVAYRRKRLYVSWTRRTCWRKKPLKSFVFC